ncbi:MAG TPA: hypothetical protein VLA34_13030, partial [Candidatus Krumholzibacterium sp.]|nr:hypothetical protein [Candidatus Krumholzibacterium sp.]
GSGDFTRAEGFVREGCRKVGEDRSRDLLITLAETLERNDMNADSARIFREIIDGTDDRLAVWKRIESARQKWIEKELESASRMIEAGGASPEEIERSVRLAIDAGQSETAIGMTGSAGLPPTLASILRASALLATDKPILALAVCGAARAGDAHEGLLRELLSIEGAASEMIGDHGRAMSAYMKLFETDATDLHARRRAQYNYTMMLESEIDDNSRLLVKTGTIEPAGTERTER